MWEIPENHPVKSIPCPESIFKKTTEAPNKLYISMTLVIRPLSSETAKILKLYTTAHKYPTNKIVYTLKLPKKLKRKMIDQIILEKKAKTVNFLIFCLQTVTVT